MPFANLCLAPWCAGHPCRSGPHLWRAEPGVLVDDDRGDVQIRADDYEGRQQGRGRQPGAARADQPQDRRASWTAPIVLLGVFATALFYGDSIITPAMSVLSAAEGLTYVSTSFEPFIVPIALVILVGLFAIQSRGTETVGKLFGPIMILYFLTLAALGDWEAQGTRLSQNLLHDNQRPAFAKQLKGGMMCQDIFVEVGHGPTLIDNNILLSDASLRFATQGVAMVHNLICGALTCVGEGTSWRYTPYHMPHRTEVMGFMTILHGDDRFFIIIFSSEMAFRRFYYNA